MRHLLVLSVVSCLRGACAVEMPNMQVHPRDFLLLAQMPTGCFQHQLGAVGLKQEGSSSLPAPMMLACFFGFTTLAVASPARCPQSGWSLLALKGELHRSSEQKWIETTLNECYFGGKEWYERWEYCYSGGCAEEYPAGPEVCTNDHSCVPARGTCLYASRRPGAVGEYNRETCGWYLTS